MSYRGSRGKQKGAVLWMLLIAIIMAGSFAFYRTSNNQFNRVQQGNKLAENMALAKEALIARAVMDENRPGSLPCPDLMTDSSDGKNKPGDGGADTLTGAATGTCPSYVGWLPWKTLDLPEIVDGTGTRLWYVLSRKLTDDESASPINSDTKTALWVDGNNEIAALIIAPQGPLNGQINRPSHTPSDYLDGENGNADDQKYITGPQSDSFNDLVLTITRQELMAAIEKRVANEVRSCLEQHAKTTSTYPWPAPLSNAIFKGVSGSLFGMVPDTQPGNPDEALRQTISKLDTTKISLDSALTAGDLAAQRSAILETQEFAAYARVQFDRLFILASALKKAADESAEDKFCETPSPQPNFKTLSLLFQSGTKNGTSFTESVSRFAETTQKTLPTFAPLLVALVDSGIDLLTTKLKAQNNTLLLRRNAAAVTIDEKALNALLTQINSIRNGVLEYSLTSNLALNASLTSAISAVTIAHTNTLAAKNALGDIEKLDLVIASTDVLIAANSALLNTTKTYTFTLGLIERAGEIMIGANRIADQAIQLSAIIEKNEQENLLFQTKSTRALVASIQPSKDLSALHENALRLLDISLETLGNSNASQTSITPALMNASKSMFLLANAINPDPAREALIAFKTNLLDSISAPPATLSSAQNLADQIKGILYWARVASDQANDIARLSRKSVCAKDDSTSSAYTAARKLLDSIDGESGSIAAIDKPNTNTASKVATTAALLDTLLDKTKTLEGLLEAPYAAAGIPTAWEGSSCGFLKPSTGTDSWWAGNNWKYLIFYQISNRIFLEPGTLKVNGSGNYKTVVVAGGKAINSQDHIKRTTANFLEGINADSSRDELAISPSVSFTTQVLSNSFNDRLAY